ncbi:MAG: acylhydrolase [Alistipes sp.]|nr:acylhydrolase [Alistipes sp.]
MRKLFALIIAILSISVAYAQPRAVFMGDSIFDSWDSTKHGGHPQFFKNNNFVNCGKSGEVTAQMVARFQRDVIDKNPDCVIICGGTNDIAQNKGYVPNRLIMKNIKTMTKMAEQHHIEVILCTILPAARYPWRPEIEPVKPIRNMNRRIARFAKHHHRKFIDFYTPLATKHGALQTPLSKDGVHPNSECYTVMERIVLSTL